MTITFLDPKLHRIRDRHKFLQNPIITSASKITLDVTFHMQHDETINATCRRSCTCKPFTRHQVMNDRCQCKPKHRIVRVVCDMGVTTTLPTRKEKKTFDTETRESFHSTSKRGQTETHNTDSSSDKNGRAPTATAAQKTTTSTRFCGNSSSDDCRRCSLSGDDYTECHKDVKFIWSTDVNIEEAGSDEITGRDTVPFPQDD